MPYSLVLTSLNRTSYLLLDRRVPFRSSLVLSFYIYDATIKMRALPEQHDSKLVQIIEEEIQLAKFSVHSAILQSVLKVSTNSASGHSVSSLKCDP